MSYNYLVLLVYFSISGAVIRIDWCEQSNTVLSHPVVSGGSTGGDGGDRPPPKEVEKITSSTIVVNFCADFVGVPVISALFSNQAPSTINIMKIAVCRMHLVRYQLLLPRLVATS